MDLHTVKIIFLTLLIATLPCLSQVSLGNPFVWNRDHFWKQLEQRFVKVQSGGCDAAQREILSSMEALVQQIAAIEEQPLAQTDPLWQDAEDRMLTLAPLLAACPERFDGFVQAVERMQSAVKEQAAAWPADDPETRRRIYRITYAGRSAVEEILLQSRTPEAHHMWKGAQVQPADTPSTTVHGVTIYSGDMLVTRGGAATSALIARGNDYPGNFSHVALAHVDAATGEPSVIEALIESGVVVTDVRKFLEDKKFRIMVLRLLPDLPAVARNPGIAHMAAQWAIDSARQSHIPYDFQMDFHNHDKLFCAELIYAAYESVGITLWSGLSHISAAGTKRWLEAFGVKHFTTLEPSDLEYDPQLTRVVEWYNPDTLYEDHVHNAVTDVLLEGANSGDQIKYNRFLLPVAWGLKGYSWLQTSMGNSGPVPQGMGCRAALRNKWYTREHARMVDRVLKEADEFKVASGYRPPYWELVRIARGIQR